MPKKTKSVPKAPATPSLDRRKFFGGLDPLALCELLDNRYVDNGTSPYQKLFQETFDLLLQRDVDSVHFAKVLDGVDVFAGVEDAIRVAGFCQGFRACQELLLGELDLEALKAKLPDGAL
jgi:hypothetical protein